MQEPSRHRAKNCPSLYDGTIAGASDEQRAIYGLSYPTSKGGDSLGSVVAEFFDRLEVHSVSLVSETSQSGIPVPYFSCKSKKEKRAENEGTRGRCKRGSLVIVMKRKCFAYCFI